MEFQTDIFKTFDKKWALLTAGDKDSFNTMTISWGGLGTLWNKPVATVYVRSSRYTHDFMDNNEYFTISFYPEEYKKVLGVLGSKSGRDMDKMHESGLTAKEIDKSMTFAEAEVTLVCRKLFKQELAVANMPKDIADSLYAGDAPHDMYIGEVVDIIEASLDLDEGAKSYAFVDGSFNESTGTYGYGGYLVVGDKKFIIRGSGTDSEMASMRNVAGEISGSKAAIEMALEKGVKELDIYYDYNGIRMWATGEWKRNKKYTIAYYDFIQSIKDKIKLNFIKVKGHSGIEGNEEADRLAKQAAGII